MSSIQFALIRTVIQAFRSLTVRKAAAQAGDVSRRVRRFEALAGLLPFPLEAVCEPVDVAGIRGAWIAAPGGDPDRTVLYLHGGGYIMGSVATHRELAARLSRAAGSRLLLIDYRLAPDHPYPAAVEDAAAAYRWLLDRGADPARTAIAGDSAGGGLAVATLVALRDGGVALPAAGVCLSPWTDLAGTGGSMVAKAGIDPLIDPDELRMVATIYLSGADPTAPLASPLYADLAGLPPLLIQVGTAEILLDDAVRLARCAEEAGVRVTLETWEDMIHVWHLFAAVLPEGRRAVQRIGAFIREHTD